MKQKKRKQLDQIIRRARGRKIGIDEYKPKKRGERGRKAAK